MHDIIITYILDFITKNTYHNVYKHVIQAILDVSKGATEPDWCFPHKKDRALAVHVYRGLFRHKPELDRHIQRYCKVKLSLRIFVIIECALYMRFFLHHSYNTVQRTVSPLLRKQSKYFQRVIWGLLHKTFNASPMIPNHALARYVASHYSPSHIPIFSSTCSLFNPNTAYWIYQSWQKQPLLHYVFPHHSAVERLGVLESPLPVVTLPYYVPPPEGTWIQNIGSVLPLFPYTHVDNFRVLDLCAAPGGKTAFLSAYGAKVTALDINAKRLTRLRENMHRLHNNVDIVHADGRYWNRDSHFDLVVVDTPCTGTGRVARNPELPYIHKTPNVLLIKQLLHNALRRVKKGGTLIYITCSLLWEENQLIAQWMEALPSVSLYPYPRSLYGKFQIFITPEGYIFTLPNQKYPCMATFFAARFRVN